MASSPPTPPAAVSDADLPAVTVAICTHNRAELLRQTLAGAVLQDYPVDRLEILVVDNNSTDHTKAVVEEFAGSSLRPRRVFETEKGLNAARNRAVAEARGSIVVFADDDILVETDWIRQLMAPFARDPREEIGCVGGEVIPVFPEGKPDWISEWHAPLAFRADAGPLTAKQVPMGANFAVRRGAFARTGNFAAGLDRTGKSLFGGGDREIVRRIRECGWQVWFAPAAAVRHQMPASRTTFAYAARHAFDSARSRVFERAMEDDARSYLLSRALVNVFKAAGYALLALLQFLVIQTGAGRKSLVRAWRSCGYIYEVVRCWRLPRRQPATAKAP